MFPLTINHTGRTNQSSEIPTMPSSRPHSHSKTEENLPAQFHLNETVMWTQDTHQQGPT
jgi:hypothetical protein